ncbi:hypothetical protein J6590_049600 [Homalodisca vitripennis]|nr:hypothetical protein J6590_049600 [Homalodisca vitripennis]
MARNQYWLATFQLNLHWAQQKPMCHFNLGNLMDVQERHITNHKLRDSGVQGLSRFSAACFRPYGKITEDFEVSSDTDRESPKIKNSSNNLHMSYFYKHQYVYIKPRAVLRQQYVSCMINHVVAVVPVHVYHRPGGLDYYRLKQCNRHFSCSVAPRRVAPGPLSRETENGGGSVRAKRRFGTMDNGRCRIIPPNKHNLTSISQRDPGFLLWNSPGRPLTRRVPRRNSLSEFVRLRTKEFNTSRSISYKYYGGTTTAVKVRVHLESALGINRQREPQPRPRALECFTATFSQNRGFFSGQAERLSCL